MSSSQNIHVRGELLRLYLTRLRTLWAHADLVRTVHRRGESKLYRMLFASNHQAGINIAQHLSRRPSGQFDLDL
ncbi:MAG: hypothetical protein AAB319_03360 [Pseudomonadota bacterium]